MVGRLLMGLVKGLVLGGLLGFALVKLGMGTPNALIAYLAAAVTGVLTGLVAGKPIWAKDAKIEAGTKAVFGAILGVGLMAAVRTWLLIPIPFALGALGPEHGATATVGGYAITALAAIAAVLAGFYDADNDSAHAAEATGPRVGAGKAPPAKRIAESSEATDEEELLDSPRDQKRTKH